MPKNFSFASVKDKLKEIIDAVIEDGIEQGFCQPDAKLIDVQFESSHCMVVTLSDGSVFDIMASDLPPPASLQ